MAQIPNSECKANCLKTK